MNQAKTITEDWIPSRLMRDINTPIMNNTFFTLVGIQEKLKETPTYKSLTTENRQNLLLDKCNFVVNSIINGNRQHHNFKNGNGFSPIGLHTDVLRSQLGTHFKKGAVNYLTILNLLQEADIITSDHKYKTLSKNPKIREQQLQKGFVAESKKYNISEQYQQQPLCTVEILHPNTIKKLQNYTKKRWNNIKGVAKYQAIHRSNTQVWFDHYIATDKRSQIDFSKKKNPLQSQAVYDADFVSLCQLNELHRFEEFEAHPDYYLHPSLKCGRVFHLYNRIPSVYRECLKLRGGESLSEVDKICSQPFFIIVEYYTHLQEIKSDATYIDYTKRIEDRIRRDIDNSICNITFDDVLREAGTLLNSILLKNKDNKGKFYSNVAEYCRQEGSLELHRLYEEDYGEYKRQLLGYGLYNGNKHTGRQLPLQKAHAFERHLYEMFPFFMAYIRMKKQQRGYRSVSIDATTLESKIFIDGIFNRVEATKESFFAIPVHDSLIVRSEEANRYQQILFELIKSEFKGIFDIYGSQLTASSLFRITHY